MLYDHVFFPKKEIWDALMYCHDVFGLACASTAKNPRAGMEKLNGIIAGHGYTILATYNFTHEEKEYHMLKLRNPHGHGEW